MREIKFRFYDKKSKVMREWDYVQNYLLKALEDNRDNEDYSPWMQYTGLRDKNGKEIYEGDILQGERYPIRSEDAYVLVVEYDVDRFWGVRTVKKNANVRGISDGIADGLYEFMNQGLVVIGNIYEHPHLLEGGDAE